MKEAPKVAVRYIGNQASYTDHLYNTGATWEFGESVLVPADAAPKLLRHTEFEEGDAEEAVTEAEGKPKEPEAEEPINEAPLANLENMTKAELVTYAHRNFGVELDGNAKKAELIDAVRLHMGKRPA